MNLEKRRRYNKFSNYMARNVCFYSIIIVEIILCLSVISHKHLYGVFIIGAYVSSVIFFYRRRKKRIKKMLKDVLVLCCQIKNLNTNKEIIHDFILSDVKKIEPNKTVLTISHQDYQYENLFTRLEIPIDYEKLFLDQKTVIELRKISPYITSWGENRYCNINREFYVCNSRTMILYYREIKDKTILVEKLHDVNGEWMRKR